MTGSSLTARPATTGFPRTRPPADARAEQAFGGVAVTNGDALRDEQAERLVIEALDRLGASDARTRGERQGIADLRGRSQSQAEFEADRRRTIATFRDRGALLPGNFLMKSGLTIERLFAQTRRIGSQTQLGSISVASEDVVELRSLVKAWHRLDRDGSLQSFAALREDPQPTRIIFTDRDTHDHRSEMMHANAWNKTPRTLYVSRTHAGSDTVAGAAGSRALVFAHEMQHAHMNPFISARLRSLRSGFERFDDAEEFFVMRYEAKLARALGVKPRMMHAGVRIPARDPNRACVQLEARENGKTVTLFPGDRSVGRLSHVDDHTVVLAGEDGRRTEFSAPQLAELASPALPCHPPNRRHFLEPLLPMWWNWHDVDAESRAHRLAAWRSGAESRDVLHVEVRDDGGVFFLRTHEGSADVARRERGVTA